ncbi:hypothetical protein MMYC01_203581 [Madurella mycetomatis]|uniref:Uncharacterized protein n=1 Tax=Madurella mycetomatis TaxID=100816 RepID=A0A175W9A0_9PEZI|nr:hypothetical protein MMYC01_203581 [Madurella mycetomatis]
MEALKNLISNVPDWLQKLDELNGKIEQRQIELAQLTEASKSSSPEGNPSAPARSLRNKGSTESLKPRNEPEAHPRDPTPQPEADAAETAAAAAAGAAAARAIAEQPAPSSPAESQSPSALQRQTNQVRAAGQARARATLRKRQRTDSVISAEGGGPKYRTRSMIIVYYDSYVQNFFEGLVKFVSASRNMMRKAKMAAKVAQIKRLAELEMPDDDEDDQEEDDKATNPPAVLGTTSTTPTPAVSASLAGNGTIEAAPAPSEGPTPPYVSTRQMGRGPSAMMMRSSRAMYMRASARGSYRSGGLGPDGKPQQGDVYDELDKGLEYVQSMCEHAAHQFLRDGDCAEEVANIQRRLRETKELADKEMERVRKEEPAALNAPVEDETRGRSYRPQSMRKGTASTKDAKQELEVDDAAEETEEPKLVYKSTRMMT